jgi:hypothetical protein
MISYLKNTKKYCKECVSKNINNTFTYSDNMKIYYLLYHKISNFQKLTEIEIYLIELLYYNEQIKIIQLLNECIDVLVSYMDL